MALLELSELTKRFGRVLAVDGLTLSVGGGEVFGLLGPNGSGKTTSLACALGLERPTSGAARVLGIPAARFHETRGRVGVVFDREALVPGLSARANLDYARTFLPKGGRGPAEVLERVGLARHAKRRATTLSLGQRKRLAIARALLGEPELLVLDEPLSGLDPMGVRETLALVRELAAEGTTILLSSHRLAEMERVVTHAAILAGGRLLTAGPIESILGAEGELALVVDDPDRAHEVLAGGGMAVMVDEAVQDADERLRSVRVRPGETPACEVNRVLVEAGVRVHRLAQSRRGLTEVFEGLVSAALEGPDGAGGRP